MAGEPTTVRVGQVYEHFNTKLRVRVVQVPGGRRRVFKVVYDDSHYRGLPVSKAPRTFRGELFHTHYRLIEEAS